jgi:hypothetical protein
MAATVSGSKTCNNSITPGLTASALTTLMSTAVENMTVAQLLSLAEGLRHVGKGLEPTTTIGSIFV